MIGLVHVILSCSLSHLQIRCLSSAHHLPCRPHALSALYLALSLISPTLLSQPQTSLTVVVGPGIPGQRGLQGRDTQLQLPDEECNSFRQIAHYHGDLSGTLTKGLEGLIQFWSKAHELWRALLSEEETALVEDIHRVCSTSPPPFST